MELTLVDFEAGMTTEQAEEAFRRFNNYAAIQKNHAELLASCKTIRNQIGGMRINVYGQFGTSSIDEFAGLTKAISAAEQLQGRSA